MGEPLPSLKELYRRDPSTHPLFKGLFAIGGVTSGFFGVVANSLVMAFRWAPALPSASSPYGYLLHIPHWGVWALCVISALFYNDIMLAVTCAALTLQLILDVIVLYLVVSYNIQDVTLVISFGTAYGLVIGAVFLVLSIITNIFAWRLLFHVMPLCPPTSSRWKKR
jgi:hypothetical protein